MQQLFLDGRIRTHGQGQPTLRLVKPACPVDQLKAQCFESFESPERRALGRGVPIAFVGDHLQVPAEVVSEDGREKEDLVASEVLRWNVVELALRLQLGKNAFLRSSTIVEADDLTSANLPIGDENLELISVDLRNEQIKLDGLLGTDDRASADAEEAVAAAPSLGLPFQLEVPEILTDPVPPATAFDFAFELDEALKRDRDGELYAEPLKQGDQVIAEESAVHSDFDTNAGQYSSNRVDAGEDELPRTLGVMDISWPEENIEHLARLSDCAKQRIIAALALLLAIESHRGTLCIAASADDRAVKVKGQATRAKLGQCLQDHLSDELSQRGDACQVGRRQQATESGDIRQAIQAKDTLHHGVVAVVTDVPELPKADQEVNDKVQDYQGMIVSAVGPEVAEAIAQAVPEIEPLEQELEDEQPSEGGQLLVFESQLRDGVGFTLYLVPAKLHGERPPWVGFGALTTPLYQPRGRFFYEKGTFSRCHY